VSCPSGLRRSKMMLMRGEGGKGLMREREIESESVGVY
jgi:hypothetical protein